MRKSLGARNRDILLQFLVEALVLSLIGGTIGMILGWMAGSGIAKLAGWPPLIQHKIGGGSGRVFFGRRPVIRHLPCHESIEDEPR